MSIFITRTKTVKVIIIVTMDLKSFMIYTLLFIVSASFTPTREVIGGRHPATKIFPKLIIL